MAQLIRTESELINLFLPMLKDATEYVVQKIFDENKDLVDKLVYGAGDPTVYERTGEFETAWSTETRTSGGNKVEGEFKYDSSKMSVNASMGQHASFATGQDVRQYMADIIYQGSAGLLFGEGFWTKKRDAWAALDKWLTNSQFRNIFEEGMNKAGIPWKRNKASIQKTEW